MKLPEGLLDQFDATYQQAVIEQNRSHETALRAALDAAALVLRERALAPVHALISEMDDQPWPHRFLHVGTIAAALSETDDGVGAPPAETPPQAVAASTPAPSSLAGQREHIKQVLASHSRSAASDSNGRIWSSCTCGWEDEDRHIDPFKWADHRLDAVLATLVDLGSEETRRRAYSAAFRAWQNQSERPTDFAAEISAAVLAALTSGEQTHG